MIVAALALDRLHDERGHVVLALREELLGLRERGGLAALRVGERVGRGGEMELRVIDARPVELWEVLRLARVGRVRHRQRVAAAAVEGLAQVHDLRAALGLHALREVLAHFPVEGRLDRVLDRQRAAFDEEHVLGEGRGHGHAREGLDELGHVGRVDVGVGRLVHGGVGDAVAELGIVEARVVVADGAGGEIGEEVEHRPPALRVENPRSLGLSQIHDDVVAVGEHVPREDGMDIRRLNMKPAINNRCDGHR